MRRRIALRLDLRSSLVSTSLDRLGCVVGLCGCSSLDQLCYLTTTGDTLSVSSTKTDLALMLNPLVFGCVLVAYGHVGVEHDMDCDAVDFAMSVSCVHYCAPSWQSGHHWSL